MTETVIEFCISKEQTSSLSLSIPDHGDRVRDLLAEALYTAKDDWKRPERAAATMVSVLGAYSSDMALSVGARRAPGADVIVVDFISRLISDRTEQKSYKFSCWTAKHGVPE